MDQTAQNPTGHADDTTPPTPNMEILDRPSMPAPLLLRHRLFPRAMAWDLHQTSASERVHEMTEQRLLKAARIDDSRSTSPFANNAAQTFPFHALPPPSVDSRERLFRTIGKWLDNQDAPPSSSSSSSSSHHHQQPHGDHYHRSEYYAPRSPPTATHANYNDHRHQPSASFDMLRLDSPTTSYPSPTHSSSSGSGSSKKRQRGPSGSTAPPSSSVARPGMSTSSAKRCSVEDCGKIAVSKGLCRGHGGGRRCTFTGCTKCAQSRSPFCWAHGGGKRCEAPNCRRSRKTKRFCVDHMELEATTPLSMATDSDDSGDYHSHANSDTETSSIASAPAYQSQQPPVGALHLPSLSDALKRAVPSAVARAAAGKTVTLPQSFDRLWPQQQQATVSSLAGRSWM